ncbi:transmembrane protein 132C [Sardina pilchardus]|uniref:transmembrane protein 132C n=1 Tax=Sardina pilchardus TaxID=27697 RepID=UPI002E1243A8
MAVPVLRDRAVMSVADCPSSPCDRGVTMVILLCYCFTLAGAQQLPPPVSLPAQISVPPPWSALSLSQADLGVIFSNSSPFSHSQPLLLMPPPRTSSKAGVRASFGPYSVTQLVSTPVLPLSPPLSASLLTKTVMRAKEGEKGKRSEVRVLFHMRGDVSKGTCITLHAFKETEEQKASCITQSPLGLCVVSLTLPKDWFELDQSVHANTGQNPRARYQHRHRQRNRARRRQNVPSALRDNSVPAADRIQLYYSSSGAVSDFKTTTLGCVEDDTEPMQRRLYYVGAVALPHREKDRDKARGAVVCSDGEGEEELRLDYNVVIRFCRGPVRTGQPARIFVNLRSNFTGDSVTIRLKVKKGLVSVVEQPSMNSDLWSVVLERTTGSKHDTVSIICHKVGVQSAFLSQTDLLEVACLLVDGLKRSFGVAMTVTTIWWTEYSNRNTNASPHGAVTSFLSFTDRDIVGIAPITESSTIINTAILTSQPVTLPVIVLAVGHDGKVSDVTSAVRCQSANEDIVKVSSDCSTLFVDGSESGVGSTCVEVEFLLGQLSGSVCLSVWAPVVPLRISLSDYVLSAIDGWSFFNQGRCTPVFQRSTVQVLAQFSAHSSTKKGQPTYMLGSPDWFVDVTELVWDWLRVGNPRVATLNKQGYLVGLEPGITTLHVISSQWDGVLGSAEVVVSSEPVTPGDLSVQLVGGLGLVINSNPAHQSVVTAAVTAHNILYNYGQEASASVWLQFNDDTAILVSAFTSVPHSLRLSSLAESVVAVTPEPVQRILAQGEGGGPLVKAELLVSTCEPVSNNVEANVVRDGGGTRRLAKGSGWIRVNLDSEVWPIGSDSNSDMFDVSDMLLESDKDFYSNFGDKVIIGNITSDYTANTGDGLITRNDLERAVLNPNHQESAVYFSPGMGRGRGQPVGDRDLEVGLGAVLSLICLSALLFLANCLPCALRERKKRKQREKEGQGMQGVQGGIEVGEDEGEEKEESKLDEQVARLKTKVKFCKGDKIHTIHTDIKSRD